MAKDCPRWPQPASKPSFKHSVLAMKRGIVAADAGARATRRRRALAAYPIDLSADRSIDDQIFRGERFVPARNTVTATMYLYVPESQVRTAAIYRLRCVIGDKRTEIPPPGSQCMPTSAAAVQNFARSIGAYSVSTLAGVTAAARALLLPACLLANWMPASAAASTDSRHSSAQTAEYWVEQVAEGLRFPSSMAWLPNGDMLITERAGGLRIVRSGRLDPEPIQGTPQSYRAGLNGLREVLLDPDYANNQTLYFLTSEGNAEQYHAAVFRGRYAASGLSGVERIFRSKDAMSGAHSIAGRMLFLPDKTLLVAITASISQNKALAQQLNSHIGKIVRINRDGSVPADNPFVTTPGALPEIWSYGHRVQLGLYRDERTGELWEVDSGPRGGDEINLLKAGANYGWAKASWGFEYDNKGSGASVQTAEDVEEPVLVWTPSVTPAGFTRYYGSVFPHWQGDYFVGQLTGKALERLRIENSRVIFQEYMLLDLDERIRDVQVGPDGYVYLLTDRASGRVLRLQPGKPSSKQLSRVARKLEIASTPLATDATRAEKNTENVSHALSGRQAFIENCAGCHAISGVIEGGDIGPDLGKVAGRRIGHAAGFDFSAAMRRAPGEWSAATLDRFLVSPEAYIPGTRMQMAPITDSTIRQRIISFLTEPSLQPSPQPSP